MSRSGVRHGQDGANICQLFQFSITDGIFVPGTAISEGIFCPCLSQGYPDTPDPSGAPPKEDSERLFGGVHRIVE